MDRTEFFKDLGFSEYEAKTLSSLIKLKAGNPKEISLDSGVPQNKLYQILRKFEGFGILAILPTEPKKYELINIKTFIEKRLKEKQEKLKQLKESSKNIELIKDNEKQAVFSLIKGQKAIMNKLAEANKNVKTEIFGIQRNWKVWGTGLREIENAVKRGIDVKLIGIIDKNDKNNIKKVKEWKKTGAKIKAYNEKFGNYPLRFSIFDNKRARITVGKPEIQNSKDYITIWTDSKAFIAMLRKQFLEMWKEGKKF